MYASCFLYTLRPQSVYTYMVCIIYRGSGSLLGHASQKTTFKEEGKFINCSWLCLLCKGHQSNFSHTIFQAKKVATRKINKSKFVTVFDENWRKKLGCLEKRQTDRPKQCLHKQSPCIKNNVRFLIIMEKCDCKCFQILLYEIFHRNTKIS